MREGFLTFSLPNHVVKISNYYRYSFCSLSSTGQQYDDRCLPITELVMKKESRNPVL